MSLGGFRFGFGIVLMRGFWHGLGTVLGGLWGGSGRALEWFQRRFLEGVGKVWGRFSGCSGRAEKKWDGFGRALGVFCDDFGWVLVGVWEGSGRG